MRPRDEAWLFPVHGWISEAGLHLLMRAVSAVASFLLFAVVARYLTTDETRQVYFFSFALGFLIVSLRTYCNTTALLYAERTRANKLRKVSAVSRQLPWFMSVVSVVAIGIFSLYHLQWWVVLGAIAAIGLCGFDADLLRAVVGRPIQFTSAFAVGGLLSLGYLWIVAPSTKEGGCVAFIVQWIPVALINVKAYARLWGPRARPLRVIGRTTTLAPVDAMLTALYDGAILNAPFLAGPAMDVGASMDLSISTRLFVSSLPLLPLVTHWSNIGRMDSLAKSSGVPEYAIFGGVLVGTGLAAGLGFAVLYSLVGASRVTGVQIGLFVWLLGAYVFYASMVRYGICRVRVGVRMVVLGGLQVTFYTLLLNAGDAINHSATLVVALQTCALALAGGVGWLGLRAYGRAASGSFHSVYENGGDIASGGECQARTGSRRERVPLPLH